MKFILTLVMYIFERYGTARTTMVIRRRKSNFLLHFLSVHHLERQGKREREKFLPTYLYCLYVKEFPQRCFRRALQDTTRFSFVTALSFPPPPFFFILRQCTIHECGIVCGRCECIT